MKFEISETGKGQVAEGAVRGEAEPEGKADAWAETGAMARGAGAFFEIAEGVAEKQKDGAAARAGGAEGGGFVANEVGDKLVAEGGGELGAETGETVADGFRQSGIGFPVGGHGRTVARGAWGGEGFRGADWRWGGDGPSPQVGDGDKLSPPLARGQIGRASCRERVCYAV